MRFPSLKNLCAIIALYFLYIATAKTSVLPPILDFYPLCQYTIKDTISVKRRINDRLKKSSNPNTINYETNLSAIAEETRIALESLQKAAGRDNALALVLVSRTLDYSPLKGRPGIYLRYRADLISECDNLTADVEKPAPIASHGKKILSRYSKKQVLSTQSTFGVTQQSEEPTFKNRNVSLKNGIYGIKLGTSIQRIYAELGEPSAHVDLLEGESVLGYGRYHWFHFHKSKLVKVESRSTLLGQTSLNLIPYRNFFDDSLWKINDRIELKASLGSIQKLFPNKPFNEDSREIVLEDSNEKLILKFTAIKDPNTEIIDYFLESFSLLDKSYQQWPRVNIDPIERQNSVIQTALTDLSSRNSFSIDRFRQKMGKPIAEFQLKGDEKVVVYSPSLYIRQTSARLTEIGYVDHLLSTDLRQEQSKTWSLNNFYRGQPFELAKKYFSDDGYATEEMAEIETATHQIELRFEEQQGTNRVNEITVYLF